MDKVQFKWLDDEELLKISKLALTCSEDLNSNYLGATIDNNCLTCALHFKQCPGHFGSYEFLYPMVHPLLAHETRVILKEKGFKTRVFQNVVQIKDTTNNFRTFCALDVDETARSDTFFRKYLPISSLCVRPSCITPGTRSGVSQNDLTHRLASLIRLDQSLRHAVNLNNENVVEHRRILTRLQLAYVLLFWPPPGQVKTRELSCLSQRFKGKEGRCRSTMLGKRIDFSARSVISSDSFISVDEVGLPREIYEGLTVIEHVTSWNIGHLSQLLREKKIKIIERGKMKIDPRYRRNIYPLVGDIFHRYLQNGDYVLANRQPTLWRSSIQAMKVVKLPLGKTIRFNVDVTPPFNADFDGDEICIFVPQAIDSRGEMHSLMATKEHIVIGGVGVVQDAALCLWILSHENPFVGQSLFFDCLMHLSVFDLSKVTSYDGRNLVQQMLPDDLQLPGIYERGRILAGINKKVAKKKIVPHIYKKSKEAAIQFLNSLQRISAEYFARRGFSVGLSCLEIDKLHLITNDDNDMSIKGDDWEVIRRGMQYKENNAHKAKGILNEKNRFLTLTSERSCAKGSLLNIIQMLSSLGQQFVKGTIIKPYRYSERGNRVLSSDKFDEQLMTSHGYIESAFLKGLNPQEFFLHAISSRLSLLDTALKTATSGYASRRLWKSMEDMIVQYDMSLRCNGRMILFHVDADELPETKLEPGFPSGLEAAEHIGQMIMQLTLNTFHLAGTNNATVTSGVPRLESLINVWSKKQQQQRLVYQQNVDAWTAHNIILKEDTVYVKDLKPTYHLINFKSHAKRSAKSIRFTFNEKKCIRMRVTMWHIEQAIRLSAVGKYCIPLSKKNKLSIVIQTPNGERVSTAALMELKDYLLTLKLRGKGQNIFYNNGTLERKGISLSEAFIKPEWKNLHSTSIIETAKTLGICAAKDQLIIELNKVFNNAVEMFYIRCLAEWMCNKGKLTSTTRSGITSFYEEENTLKFVAFERALRTASKAAADNTVATFEGLSERILVNKLIKQGAGFCEMIHDNQRFIELEDEMEGKRMEELKKKRTLEFEEEPWISYDGVQKRSCYRPTTPTYSPTSPEPFKPTTPTYSPISPEPFKPTTPTYSPTDPEPYRPISPVYDPFAPDL